MRAVRLIAASDGYDRQPGLKIVGTPATDDFMAAREGLLIAHDIIEHQNGPANIGTVWDELEALGGIWHARGRWGDMMTQSIHNPATNVAADLTRMFPAWLEEWSPPRRGTYATLWDDEYREALEEARRDIPLEHDFTEMHEGDDALDRYLDEALHRFRIGFRKASRRFGTRFESNNIFRAIKEACDPVCKYIDYEGQEFILTWGAGQACVRELTGDFE